MTTGECGAHAHAWKEVGTCAHPSKTAIRTGRVYRCTDCGAWGHKIEMYLCGIRRRKGETVGPADCPLADAATWSAAHLTAERAP